MIHSMNDLPSFEESMIKEMRHIVKALGFELPQKVLIDGKKHYFDGNKNGCESEWYKLSLQEDSLLLTLNSDDPSLRKKNDYVREATFKRGMGKDFIMKYHFKNS